MIKQKILPPSLLAPKLPLPLLVDHWWTGEDRSCRLEDQHPPEALHKWKQRGAVVLAGSGGLQRGEERTPPAVCHGLHQGSLAGIQSAAGWVMDWLRDHTHSHLLFTHHLLCSCDANILVCLPEDGYKRPLTRSSSIITKESCSKIPVYYVWT